MRSLRTRLSTVVGCGVFAFVLATGFAISTERWQQERSGLLERVTLASFRLAESDNNADFVVTVSGGRDVVGLMIDNPPDVIASSGAVSDELVDIAIDELWPDVVDLDSSVSITIEDGSGLTHVSAVACADTDVCDTAVVAATESSLTDYLGARWMWIFGPALLMTALAVLATRALVGRSLRPVGRMSTELEAIASTDLDRRVSAPRSGDELERLGTAMNDTIGRLGSAVAANRRFVADAAHELRSPITGVRAALEIETRNAPGGILDDAIRELDRASRLIDDLLLLARGEGGAGRRVEVDLDDLAHEQATLVAGRFPEVTVQRDISLVRMIGDPDGLRRVIGNLLENACVHGGTRATIEISSDGLFALCAVDDDGSGISADDRARIFDRFARLDDSRARSTGGSGLGLAIVAELTRIHGGSIEVLDSSLGGARFECRFPLDPSR